MILFADTEPAVDVAPAEYLRLLGYPPGAAISERSRELAGWARRWYAENGRPWAVAREAASLSVAGDAVCIESVGFSSQRLRHTLREAEAHTVIVAAVSAGPGLEEETRKLWEEEKPDEYFFLEMFGSAVVEHLITTTGARLCEWAGQDGMAVLPHYSPGYSEWDIAEQSQLLQLIAPSFPGSLAALESGALRPKKSQLAVFGLTRRTDHLRRLADIVPCHNCSFANCQYRRAPYRRNLNYAVNPKALKRWAAERLSLEATPDGGIDARFRLDGTTCSNMGRPLTFNYEVRLGSREDGYPIRDQRCAPADGDTGHTAMCQYISNGPALMAAIDREKPLLGRPLADILSWQRPVCSTGCYCEPAGREHKWGLVLETIHFALANGQDPNLR